MKQGSFSEKLLIEEINQALHGVKLLSRGLSIGKLIKVIRIQLGMSQKNLAKKAGVPQSTVSRIEREENDMNLSTLRKILKALSCNLIILPLMESSIETIRRTQAKIVAKKHINYLKGTMNLEDQQPDDLFIRELLKREEEALLQGPNKILWEE